MAATPVNTRNSTKAVATKWGNFETALKELSPVSQHFVQAEQLGNQVEELKKELRGKIHENEQEKNARKIVLQDFGNSYADWRRDRSKLEQERKDLKQKITQIESRNAQIESETLRKLQREVELHLILVSFIFHHRNVLARFLFIDPNLQLIKLVSK